jgi:ATP-dependent DNA helicase RecG
MEASEVYELAAAGEDSGHQFKARVSRADSLAQDLVAFTNSGGGKILVGISDQGTVVGLSSDEVRELNQLLSSAASQHVEPPIHPITENVLTSEGVVVVITVADGISKPYADKNGAVWVKSGADKRKATSREEILRMYQAAGAVHGDEVPAKGLRVSDVDLEFFRAFYESLYGAWDALGVPLSQLFENMNLAKQGELNVAGALLFVAAPQFRLPAFIVKAVAFPGNDISSSTYLDSQDLVGKLSVVFKDCFAFAKRNLFHRQNKQSVNSLGELEIPEIVLEELIANALIHRDYFVSAPIRLLIFANRIEILSPGRLPNNLTVANIRLGNSNMRNPILASFATRLLPYRGLGSGIVRALKAYPQIDFENDRDGHLFKVIIHRQPVSKESQ